MHHTYSDTPTATQIKINDMMNKSEPIKIVILGENKYINQYNIIAVPIYVPLPWYINIENTNTLMMKLELNED